MIYILYTSMHFTIKILKYRKTLACENVSLFNLDLHLKDEEKII